MPKSDPSLDVFDPNAKTPAQPPPSYEESSADPTVDLSDVSGSSSYQRPQQAPPQTGHAPQAQIQHQAQATADLYTNNLSLPWRYPKGYYCKRCRNTGYDRHGQLCQKCWPRFGPQLYTVPAAVQVYAPPVPMNPAAVPLPPGAVPYFPQVHPQQMPLVVQPGDPRIGGQLCYRCQGRGWVHFFLDTETCPVCNGMGRTH